MDGSRARTPHGIALDRFLLENGPSTESSLLYHVAKHVPVGLAANTVYSWRTKQRRRSGYAVGVAANQVAGNYGADPVESGARHIAYQTLTNRLSRGTVFVNEDGLLQHRDWRPGGAS